MTYEFKVHERRKKRINSTVNRLPDGSIVRPGSAYNNSGTKHEGTTINAHGRKRNRESEQARDKILPQQRIKWTEKENK